MIEELIIVGDPILDEFRIGRLDAIGGEFKLAATYQRRGGASNTYGNAEAIARQLPLEVIMATPRTGAPVLTRYLDKDYFSLYMSIWDVLQDKKAEALQASQALWKWYVREDRNTNYYHGAPTEDGKIGARALVLSDYNKGTLNSIPPMHPADAETWVIPNIKFIIVDSKHRSLDPLWLTAYPDAVKIWRCTASEYDQEWAKQFDWIVWTAGDKSVKIFTSEYMWKKAQGPVDSWVTTVEVPIIETIDVCGAGDTFTAALAVFLCTVPAVDRQTLETGTEYAIKCAQNVCGKRFTAVTDLHL